MARKERTMYNYESVRTLLRMCFLLLIEPRSKSEDSRRKEFILNIILITVLGLMLIGELIVVYGVFLYNKPYTGISLTLFSVMFAIFVGLLIASRKQYYNIVSYVFIGIFLSGALYGSVTWGASLPASLLSYTLIVVIASILINTRFAFLLGVGIISVLMVLGYLETSHITLPITNWKTRPMLLTDSILYSVLILCTTVLSWLSNREIEKSLDRARRSEHALQVERDGLEITVAERTRDLRQAQLDKVTELYKFAEFGKLSSGIFHDLMNPLTSVSLNINQIKNSSDPNISTARAFLDKAISASRKMESVISAIRAQIHTTSTIEEVIEYSIHNLVQDVFLLLSFKARHVGVTLHNEVPASISIRGNPFKLQRALLNLVTNGIDSYDNTEDRDDKPVRVSVEQTPKNLHIIVTDKGVGIPPNIIDRVFEPFFTTKGIHKGTGYGLSITKSIVEQELHSTITVDSIEHSGTTFTIILPRT